MLKNDADEFNIRMIQSTQQKFNNSNLRYLKIKFLKITSKNCFSLN